MTKDELISKLIGDHPMTGDDAASLIVDTLLSDLSVDRQKIVKEVIEEWSSARENTVMDLALTDD